MWTHPCNERLQYHNHLAKHNHHHPTTSANPRSFVGYHYHHHPTSWTNRSYSVPTFRHSVSWLESRYYWWVGWCDSWRRNDMHMFSSSLALYQGNPAANYNRPIIQSFGVFFVLARTSCWTVVSLVVWDAVASTWRLSYVTTSHTRRIYPIKYEHGFVVVWFVWVIIILSDSVSGTILDMGSASERRRVRHNFRFCRNIWNIRYVWIGLGINQMPVAHAGDICCRERQRIQIPKWYHIWTR